MVTYSYNEIVCSNKTDQSNDLQQKRGKQSHKHFVLNLIKCRIQKNVCCMMHIWYKIKE